jgi:hypothetical protein
MWLQLATQNGGEDAAVILADLEKQVDAQKREEAQKRAQAWRESRVASAPPAEAPE